MNKEIECTNQNWSLTHYIQIKDSLMINKSILNKHKKSLKKIILKDYTKKVEML